MLKIVLGNKKYSSWSLRPWLALKQTGAPFEEVVIGLDLPDTAEKIRSFSPSGRVPALIDGAVTVWESLAICEYLAEKFPSAGLWPADAAQRALARCVSAEMHSGFASLRNECPMKIVEELSRRELSKETQADVDRIVSLWSDCLKRSGGPFLFGANPGIADAMYAPVVSRFHTYSIPAGGSAGGYLNTVWNWPALQEWVAAARVENLRAKFHET